MKFNLLIQIFKSFGGYGDVVGETEPRKAVGICKQDSEKGKYVFLVARCQLLDVVGHMVH